MIGKRRGLMADWVAKTFNRSENGQANMSPSEQISFFSTHHTEGYPLHRGIRIEIRPVVFGPG
jgi:hypothetical protein